VRFSTVSALSTFYFLCAVYPRQISNWVKKPYLGAPRAFHGRSIPAKKSISTGDFLMPGAGALAHGRKTGEKWGAGQISFSGYANIIGPAKNLRVRIHGYHWT
jgi:hypothetical protein